MPKLRRKRAQAKRAQRKRRPPRTATGRFRKQGTVRRARRTRHKRR